MTARAATTVRQPAAPVVAVSVETKKTPQHQPHLLQQQRSTAITVGSAAADSSLFLEVDNTNDTRIVDTRIVVTQEGSQQQQQQQQQQQHQQQPPQGRRQRQPQQEQQEQQQTPAFEVVSSDINSNNNNSSRTNVWFGRRLWRRHLKSLSRAATTPRWVCVLLPLLSLVTHAIFYYGQTAPMWKLHLSQHVDLWANATNMESRGAYDTLRLPHHYNVISGDHPHEKQLRTFSYWFAITELWHAKHMPGKILPRTAAILLVILSGIWPHVKLLLLNCTWLFSVNQKRRKRSLMWLSTLGKWSLADVLVVCVMVGVLHLDWDVDPEAIRNGLLEHLPFCLQLVRSLYSASDICTLVLKDVDCHIHHESWKRWSECKACVGLIKTALDHPETARTTFRPILDGIQMSGGGHVSLRVMGLNGIYAFCLAVILSIFLSLVVDILDVRAHRHANLLVARVGAAPRHHQYRPPPPPFLVPSGNDDDEHDDQANEEDLLAEEFDNDDNNHHDQDSNDGDSYAMDEPLLLGEHRIDSDGRMDEREELRSTFESSSSPPPRSWSILATYTGIWISTLITTAAVFLGIFSKTIQRSVHGAIPDVLRLVLGVVWNRDYSLYTLVQTTGAAGGWDYMLMGTFALFVVLGPALRALLLIMAWFVPSSTTSSSRSSTKKRRIFMATIELVGSFCAWEVFAIAVGMVDMLMLAITNTVVINPKCASISSQQQQADGSCLMVNFDLQNAFLWVVLGGALLILLSNIVYGRARRPAWSSSSRN